MRLFRKEGGKEKEDEAAKKEVKKENSERDDGEIPAVPERVRGEVPGLGAGAVEAGAEPHGDPCTTCPRGERHAQSRVPPSANELRAGEQFVSAPLEA